MTAFQRTIFCFIVILGSLWVFTSRRPDMTIVYPDNCAFVIDHIFSQPMQLEIKDFIDQAYKKSKNPKNLLPKIESHFPAIKSIVIDMSSLEKEDSLKVLKFTIQAYQPIFLLNDEHVICEQSKMLSKATFDPKELKKLENISFEGAPIPKSMHHLMTFFESLKYPILQDFSVRWIDKHAIWLDQKTGKDLSLLVGYDFVPSKHDVAQCRNLRGQIVDKPCKDKRGKPCKNNSSWVCDLRFDQQIVLFSTNKGV